MTAGHAISILLHALLALSLAWEGFLPPGGRTAAADSQILRELCPRCQATPLFPPSGWVARRQKDLAAAARATAGGSGAVTRIGPYAVAFVPDRQRQLPGVLANYDGRYIVIGNEDSRWAMEQVMARTGSRIGAGPAPRPLPEPGGSVMLLLSGVRWWPQLRGLPAGRVVAVFPPAFAAAVETEIRRELRRRAWNGPLGLAVVELSVESPLGIRVLELRSRPGRAEVRKKTGNEGEPL
jgi:hypothetical protein